MVNPNEAGPRPLPGRVRSVRGVIAELVANDEETRAAAVETQIRQSWFRAFAAARRRAKLNQIQAAELLGTTQSAISELEKGVVEPRLSTLQRYARKLGYQLKLQLEATPYQDRTFPYPSGMRFKGTRRDVLGDDLDLHIEEVVSSSVRHIDNVAFVDFRSASNLPLIASLAEKYGASAPA